MTITEGIVKVDGPECFELWNVEGIEEGYRSAGSETCLGIEPDRVSARF